MARGLSARASRSPRKTKARNQKEVSSTDVAEAVSLLERAIELLGKQVELDQPAKRRRDRFGCKMTLGDQQVEEGFSLFNMGNTPQEVASKMRISLRAASLLWLRWNEEMEEWRKVEA